MKTSLSVIAFVTACGPLTRGVFAWNNKPAFFTKNISPLQLLTTNKSNHSYLLNKEMSIKFGADDYEKKRHFQTFMTSAGFGASSTAYRALVAKEIDTMGMEAKLFSKDNLDKDGTFRLKTSEVLKLQSLWMWAYCKCATHSNPEDINWGITETALVKLGVERRQSDPEDSKRKGDLGADRRKVQPRQG